MNVQHIIPISGGKDSSAVACLAVFFSSTNVPGGDQDWSLGQIDKIVEWARTGRGGRQFDLLRSAENWQADEDGLLCDSAYGLCE